MERRVWRRRSVAWVMVMCMIWSMFTSIPVHAEEIDENGKTELTGLMISTDIEWNEGIPEVKESVTYSKQNLYSDIRGESVLLQYVNEAGEIIPIELEQLQLQCEDGSENAGTITVNPDNKEVYELWFEKEGDYKIVYTNGEVEDSIEVYVGLAQGVFSKTDSMESKNLFRTAEEFVYSDCKDADQNSLYLILTSDDVFLNKETLEIGEDESRRGRPFYIRDWENDRVVSDPEEVKEFVTYEEVEGKQGVYKITVMKNATFDLGVTCGFLYQGDDLSQQTGYVAAIITVRYQQKMEGLLATDMIDWSAGRPEVSENAEYSKKLWAEVGGMMVYLAYKDKEEDTAIPIAEKQEYSLKLRASNGKEYTDVITQNTQNPQFYEITFPDVGDYYIVLMNKDSEVDSIPVYVNWGNIGLYATPQQTVEGMLKGPNVYYSDDKNNEMYIITRQDENLVISDLNIAVSDAGKSVVEQTRLNDHVYKLTIQKGATCDFNVTVTCKVQWDGDNDIWEDGFRFRMIAEKGNRTTYTDGLSHVGYAGCYIEQYEFEDNHGIDYDNGLPRYWVHADTIQGVIDKLAALAQGEEIVFYDEERLAMGWVEPVQVTGIKNTGYIHINVSHFGDRELETQYVSSSGGLKGLQFESGMDVWMTVPQEGTNHTLDGSGAYIEDKMYIVYEPAWEQFPDVFDAMLNDKDNDPVEMDDDGNRYVIISRYNDRLYRVEGIYGDGEDTFYYTLGDAITDAPEKLDEIISKDDIRLSDNDNRGKVSLREMLNNEDYLYNSYMETYFMEPFRFPEIHMNMYCDMTFAGVQTAVYLGFSDDSTGTATVLTKGSKEDPLTHEIMETMVPAENGKLSKDSFGENTSFDREYTVTSMEEVTNTFSVYGSKASTLQQEEGNYTIGDEKISVDIPEAGMVKGLTDEQKEALDKGNKLHISMKSDKIEKKDLTEDSEQKKQIEQIEKKIAGEVKDKEYNMEVFDINLSASVGDSEEKTQIKELAAPTTVRIPVSKELADRIKISLNQKKNCFIVRYHEWAGSKTDVDRLPLQLVEENGKFYITFRTDRFSLYAIAYEKAALDISKVQWKTTAFTYDGQAKKVELKGVPEDVKVTYAGQFSAAEPGTYTATATFDYDTEKYATADFSKFASVQWTITKAAENPPVVTPGAPVQDNPAQPAAPSTIAQPEPAGVVAGASLTVAGNTYQVLTVDGTKTVAITGADKKAAKVAIPQTIQFNGEVFTVTSIAANAFKNCKNLKTVVIPKTVTTIGKNAFSGAKKLKKITIQGTALTSIGKNAFKNVSKKAVVKVPKSKKKAYKKLLKKAAYKGKVK